jgi:hypothetical protein
MKKTDSNIASLLGLSIKDKKEINSGDSDLDNYVEFVGEGLATSSQASSTSKMDRPVKNKRHQDDGFLNSVPEDTYMEFVGEGKFYDEEEEEEAIDSEEDSGKESDVVQNENTKNHTKQKKPLAMHHSLQLELNSKLAQRLNDSGQSPPSDEDHGDDEPLYQNFLEIQPLETRSLPRGMRLPSSPTSPSQKVKQSSFESNSDISSDEEDS